MAPRGVQARTVVQSVTAPGPLPATERVLAALPGPRVIWLLVWASAPYVVTDLLLPAVAGQPSEWGEGFVAAAINGYANIVALVGIAKLSRDVAAVRPLVKDLTQGGAGEDPFKAVGHLWGPVLLMGAVAGLYSWFELSRSSAVIMVTQTVAGFGAWFPIATLTWVGGALLVGLHRLGRFPLALKPFETDRSLGLRPLGSLAFTPLLIYAATAVPSFILGGPTEAADAIINIAVLLLLVSFVFASLFRLRRQLLEAKARHLAWARGLYAQAMEAVRADGSLDVLRSRGIELQTAEAVERRAAAIQEWPFDEGILRGIIAIVTSVTTAIIARLVLSQIGL